MTSWGWNIFVSSLFLFQNNEAKYTCMQACVRCLEKLIVREGVGQVNGLQGFTEAPAEKRVVIYVHVVDVVTGVHLWNLINNKNNDLSNETDHNTLSYLHKLISD